MKNFPEDKTEDVVHTEHILGLTFHLQHCLVSGWSLAPSKEQCHECSYPSCYCPVAFIEIYEYKHFQKPQNGVVVILKFDESLQEKVLDLKNTGMKARDAGFVQSLLPMYVGIQQ